MTLIAETQVETAKAAKYLKWLCGHFKLKVPAEYDDHQGRVQFPFGVCQLHARPDALTIRVEADDADAFARIKHVVGDHLERFGRKEALQVVWLDQPSREQAG